MSIESTSDQAPAPLDEQGVPELVDNVAVARLPSTSIPEPGTIERPFASTFTVVVPFWTSG